MLRLLDIHRDNIGPNRFLFIRTIKRNMFLKPIYIMQEEGHEISFYLINTRLSVFKTVNFVSVG